MKHTLHKDRCTFMLTLILLMWRIGWAHNNISKWQMGFNSVCKGLISHWISLRVRNVSEKLVEKIKIHILCPIWGQDISVSIATCYGLVGPGIEFRWVRDFPHLSRLALGPTHPPVQWVPSLSRGLRQPGRDDHPPPSSAEVMKE
jgi:hypothetical protein